MLQVVSGAGISGAERHVLTLARWVGRSRPVTVVCSGAGWLTSRLADEGIPWASANLDTPFNPAAVLALVRCVRRSQAQVIHGHLGRGAFYAGLAARLTGRPAVATWHEIGGKVGYARRCRAIIAVSQACADALCRLGVSGERVALVRNGVDAAEFVPAPAPGGPPVVGLVGRLSKHKGQQTLLEAAPLVLRRRPQVRFALVGGGRPEVKETLLQAAHAAGVAGAVEFLGPVDDVRPLMAGWHVVAVPSNKDAAPLSLLEAMAMGKPVVASTAYGLPEFLRDGETGLLVPPRDPARLAEAILRLLDDPALAARLGANARAAAEGAFSAERMARETTALYDRVIAGGAA